jgi:hypothetical protein
MECSRVGHIVLAYEQTYISSLPHILCRNVRDTCRVDSLAPVELLRRGACVCALDNSALTTRRKSTIPGRRKGRGPVCEHDSEVTSRSIQDAPVPAFKISSAPSVVSGVKLQLPIDGDRGCGSRRRRGPAGAGHPAAAPMPPCRGRRRAIADPRRSTRVFYTDRTDQTGGAR